MRDMNLYGISGLHQYVDAENFGLILDNVNAKYSSMVELCPRLVMVST